MNACCVCGRPVPRGTACDDCLEGLREDHDEALREYRDNRPDDDLEGDGVEKYLDDYSTPQGKRQESLDFSERVVIVAALIGFAVVGISIGCAIATATTPLP